ncbi:MAG TPA: adenylate/guanylate cyclase domain-containing protein, partial [Candidatus Rifleibacterium sp.]|nr:adenylate/guanylate cyclase domain-containing protein [Candidatus Rifleibacterium sp.]
GEWSFPVAIGVNAGEVSCGMLGFGARRDFTVIGDAVNVSARVQKEAEKMQTARCLFSASFVGGFPEKSGFDRHCLASLKGKSEKMPLYRRC